MDMLIDRIPNYIDNPLAYSNFYNYSSKILPQNVSANRYYDCEKTLDSYICLVTINYNYIYSFAYTSSFTHAVVY